MITYFPCIPRSVPPKANADSLAARVDDKGCVQQLARANRHRKLRPQHAQAIRKTYVRTHWPRNKQKPYAKHAGEQIAQKTLTKHTQNIRSLIASCSPQFKARLKLQVVKHYKNAHASCIIIDQIAHKTGSNHTQNIRNLIGRIGEVLGSNHTQTIRNNVKPYANHTKPPGHTNHARSQGPDQQRPGTTGYSMFRNSVAGSEIGLPGPIWAGLLPGKH